MKATEACLPCEIFISKHKPHGIYIIRHSIKECEYAPKIRASMLRNVITIYNTPR